MFSLNITDLFKSGDNIVMVCAEDDVRSDLQPIGLERFLPEWIEAVERDFNHPAIIGWCPFNETC